MKIDSLKDLEKLLKLCRKQGIQEMSVDGISFKLDAAPIAIDPNAASVFDDPMPINPFDDFPDGILSPEQLSHYASGGTVDDDPTRN